MKVLAYVSGFFHSIESMFAPAMSAVEDEVAKAKAILGPVANDTAMHLAEVLKDDGLRVLEQSALVALTTPGTPEDRLHTALKTAGVGLQALGVDLSKVSLDSLTEAVTAVQGKATAEGAPPPSGAPVAPVQS